MDPQRESTAKERNRDAVRRHRQKERNAEAEMQSLYQRNEQQIKRLEKMADQLSKELSRPRKR